MADQTAAIDASSNQSMIGRLNTDGKTIQRVYANASTHQVHVNDGTTGANQGGTIAATDANDRTTLFVESSAGDKSLVALYVTSAGALLIDSM